MMLFSAFVFVPFLSKAQLFIGEGVHIKGETQLYVEDNLILDANEISGKGEIVLSGKEKQTVIVKKSQTELARISVINKKGAEVKGKGHLKVSKEIYIAKGSTFSGKYLGHKLYQDKTINTKTLLTVIDKKVNVDNLEVEEKFIPEVLGYGFIINITEVVRKTTTSSTKGLMATSIHNVVANNDDFINLPLIDIYYTKKSSDYYYTQTYKDEDFSNIFKPPKIEG